MTFNDPVLYDLAYEILQCVASSLDTTTEYGAPERQYVTIGTPAHDNCCDGQLTVAFMRQFPSYQFPEEDYRRTPCGAGFSAVQLDVEIVRCAPSIDGNGNPPTADEIRDSGRQNLIEAQAVWKGVQCCMLSHSTEWTSLIRDQNAITPEGGCVGSRLTMIIGLTNGCGCE